MSDDDKLDFFLKHWKQMVEWSALRKHAADTLDRALLDALEELGQADGTTHLHVDVTGTRCAKLHLARRTHDTWLEFQRQRTRLFDGGWPQLIVVWNKDSSTKQVRDTIKQSTASTCRALGMTTAGRASDWWVWSAELAATEEPFELEEFARDCIEQFRHAWVELRGTLETAVSSTSQP